MGTRARLAPIAEQAMVITGASSDVGLATARLAARRGARVVLSACDEPALRAAVEAIRASGGEAIPVVADATDPEAMERLARAAVETYGRIDTWVAIADVPLFGALSDAGDAAMRRVLEVGYWGTVHGARAAVPHLAAARHGAGGALVVVGSAVGVRTRALQGMCSAAEHAVKGFVDALRVELEVEKVPVVVTRIVPTAIAAPSAARSHHLVDEGGRLPSPVYDADAVARAIVRAAGRPRRRVVVGGAGLLARAGERFAPRLADVLAERTFWPLPIERGTQRAGEAPAPVPSDAPGARSVRPSLQHRLATWLGLHEVEATLVAFGLGALAFFARPRHATGEPATEAGP